MLEIIGGLIDLGLVVCIFCLLKMYFNLKKSLKLTDEIATMRFLKQERKNNELAHCLECLCDTVEELEKPEPTKRGDNKNGK